MKSNIIGLACIVCSGVGLAWGMLGINGDEVALVIHYAMTGCAVIFAVVWFIMLFLGE